MNRTYKIEPDSVSFIEWKKYQNPYKGSRPRVKGTFYTRSKILQRGIGILWKWFGIGGRH